MHRFHVDQLDKAFPVGVTADRPATSCTIEQGPKRAELGLECTQRRLSLHDRFTGRLDGSLGLSLALLETRGRLAHLGKLLARGLGDAAPPVELLAQGRVTNGPGLELGPRLLLLFTQELAPAFQLAKLRVDR